MDDIWTRGPVDELTLHKPEDVPWWERIKGIKAKCSCGWTSNEWTGPTDFIQHAREYSAAQFAAERQKIQPQMIATWYDTDWVYKVYREPYNPAGFPKGVWHHDDTDYYEDDGKFADMVQEARKKSSGFADMVREARKGKRCTTCGGIPHPGLGCSPAGAEPGPYDD